MMSDEPLMDDVAKRAGVGPYRRGDGDVGATVKRLREHARLSQAELGERAGVTEAVVAAIEDRTQANPSRPILAKLAAALHVSIEQLFSLERFK